MNSLQVNPGSSTPETIKFDGKLLTEVELKAGQSGKSIYQFYSYGKGGILPVVRFIRENGEEIASYASQSPRSLEDIERSLFNAGAIDSEELPGEVREELKSTVL